MTTTPLPEQVAVTEALRRGGWSVAVHNDYRLNGEDYTFWLWTHPGGRYVKGEGRTDLEALKQCHLSALATQQPGREEVARIIDPEAWVWPCPRGAFRSDSLEKADRLIAAGFALPAASQEPGEVERKVVLHKTYGADPRRDAQLLKLERETIERCAKVAEANSSYVSDHPYYAPQNRAVNDAKKAVARRIRALSPAHRGTAGEG